MTRLDGNGGKAVVGFIFWRPTVTGACYLWAVSIDENSIHAIEKQFEMENLSTSPVTKKVPDLASRRRRVLPAVS